MVQGFGHGRETPGLALSVSKAQFTATSFQAARGPVLPGNHHVLVSSKGLKCNYVSEVDSSNSTRSFKLQL